jgi:pimeloyl-ACP methyl ester carboxylesterase
MRTIAALVLAVVTVAPATAAVDAVRKCISTRLATAGKAVSTVLKCHATAAKSGVSVDAECVSKARDKAEATLAKAEALGGCLPTVQDESANASFLAGRATGLGRNLLPASGASACQASKIKAAAKRALGWHKAHAKFVATGDRTKLGETLAKVRLTYDAALARADTKAGCIAVGDGADVAGLTDSIFDAVAGRLRLVVRETVTAPSPVEPPNTPGTPGAPAVTNPKLLAQFGGAGFSLNTVTYTRWRFGGPARTPDAILVMVPGFGGGAGNFEALAENLVTRELEDHGLVVELWGYDRRTEQLEDRAGALLAGQLGDPLVALDWYYGAELGLTLHPALVAGPNRRAEFYNTSDDVPFLANWTSLVFSRDIDAVVQSARSTALDDNVFLGGHSAGTGFAARYAATDFNLTGIGLPDPGYTRLRGVLLFEGTGGTTATAPLTSDSLDRMEAKFDGGLYGAVRDADARCVDGTTPCTVATEATDCVGQTPPVCTPSSAAHGVILGISPKILAAAEPAGVQALTDPDAGQAILQVDQGAAGNNAVAKVPDLVLLSLLAPGTVEGLFGSFLDDESILASVSAALAASCGAPGPVVGGLLTWLDRDEKAGWPACPGAGCVTPNNGPAPTTLPGAAWGQEVEAVRMDRLRSSFAGIEGANASDWYYPISGLSTTSASGVCTAGTCSKGNVGAACTTDGGCGQSISLDSTALSIGRGRRDIENLTQAGSIDIPVLGIGGSNGLAPVPGRFTSLAQSLGTCAAPSCDGTPRVIDAATPNPAFPTFGGSKGGFEVVTAEGFSHIDVVAGEDDAHNPIVRAISDFIARNVQ